MKYVLNPSTQIFLLVIYCEARMLFNFFLADENKINFKLIHIVIYINMYMVRL